jgi:hypothetical protein
MLTTTPNKMINNGKINNKNAEISFFTDSEISISMVHHILSSGLLPLIKT